MLIKIILIIPPAFHALLMYYIKDLYLYNKYIYFVSNIRSVLLKVFISEFTYTYITVIYCDLLWMILGGLTFIQKLLCTQVYRYCRKKLKHNIPL